MPREITPATNLDNLRREAKRWLKALRADDAEARQRMQCAYPNSPHPPVLRDVQHALACEYGQANWKALKEALRIRAAAGAREAPTQSAPLTPAAQKLHQAAQDFVKAYERDAAALQRLNEHYGRSFSFEDVRAELWRRVYAFRERSSRVPQNYLQLSEAQMLIAQDAGFSSWDKLMEAAATGAPPPGTVYAIDSKENRIGPRRRMTAAEWDELIAVMRERRITGLDANGLITDAALERISSLDHVTALNLGGSRELTDDGLLHLARMPQLESLNLSEYPGGKLTDRGLAVLRHLPNLRKFEMTWQSGITDAGVAHLRHCERLEQVNLMGSPTGDGAIVALQGKPNLADFSSGRLVTDAGLPLLHNFPLLKKWRGPQFTGGLEEVKNAPRLLIDGPFTNQGIASLAGLEGIAHLDLFWHVTGITTDAFAHLAGMPNLLSFRLRRGTERRYGNASHCPNTAPAPTARAGVYRHRRRL